jgi:hypothetical protein
VRIQLLILQLAHFVYEYSVVIFVYYTMFVCWCPGRVRCFAFYSGSLLKGLIMQARIQHFMLEDTLHCRTFFIFYFICWVSAFFVFFYIKKSPLLEFAIIYNNVRCFLRDKYTINIHCRKIPNLFVNDVRYIDVEIDCKKMGKMTIIYIKSTLEN